LNNSKVLYNLIMSIKSYAKRALISTGLSRGPTPILEQPFTRQSVLQGVIAARQVQQRENVQFLADIEFCVFSQWGEDGIIEWLVHHNGSMPKSFIEFGIENYTESNTRFLLYHRNWKGLVIDGSQSNIAHVKNDAVYWRYDLTATAAFITRENINNLFRDADFSGEIGILSVDIDGNDYWVWEAIDSVNPHFVIAEYNASFGDLHPLAIPYDPSYLRTRGHFSNLYWGASLSAFDHLAARKGYTRLGTNLAGSNVFYVRNDRLHLFADRIADTTGRPSTFRESRDANGLLTFLAGPARGRALADCPVTDVQSGRTGPLGSFGELYSATWLAWMAGRLS